jgi:hypothetical protein
MKSYDEVKFILSDIEPTEAMYEKLTEEDIPHLKNILKEQEPWLASRAVFAISRFNTVKTNRILYRLASDPRMEIRVSLASCANALPLEVSEKIISKLVKDKEPGVRKFAYQSVLPNATPLFIKRLKKVYNKEDVPYLQEVLSNKLSVFDGT